MTDDITRLCMRIQVKCERRGWYGPDGDAGTALVKPDGELDMEWFTRQRVGFLQVPATTEDIALTEVALGHPFPSLLRDLYTRLANGGFGPQGGLEGAFGEILYADSEYDGGTVLRRSIRAELYHFPYDDCLLLCEGGCNSKWGLHLPSGIVLRFTMEEGVVSEAASLDVWLERWIISDDSAIAHDVATFAQAWLR